MLEPLSGQGLMFTSEKLGTSTFGRVRVEVFLEADILEPDHFAIENLGAEEVGFLFELLVDLLEELVPLSTHGLFVPVQEPGDNLLVREVLSLFVVLVLDVLVNLAHLVSHFLDCLVELFFLRVKRHVLSLKSHGSFIQVDKKSKAEENDGVSRKKQESPREVDVEGTEVLAPFKASKTLDELEVVEEYLVHSTAVTRELLEAWSKGHVEALGNAQV